MTTLHDKGTTKKSGAKFPTALDFLNFFNEKVDAVRRVTGGGPPESELPPAPTVLQFYSSYTIDVTHHRRHTPLMIKISMQVGARLIA